jgi:hypothetical protein
MKNIVLRFILYVLVGIIIYLGLFRLAIVSSRVFKDGAAIICENKREAIRDGRLSPDKSKPTVIFMGNSLILSGLIPSVFDSVVNHKYYSLNLSLPALPIGPHYFVLKDYLRNNPVPDKIILLFNANIDKRASLFDYYVIQGMKPELELPSYILNRKSKFFLINYFFPTQAYSGAILKYVNSVLFSPKLIDEQRNFNEKTINNMIQDRGYYFVKEESLFPDFKLPADYVHDLTPYLERTFLENPFEDPYTKLFFDLAKTKDIDIMLISPVVRNEKYKQYDSIPNNLKMILKEYQNVKMAQDGWQLSYLENRYFNDERHLNRTGAKIYTIQIAENFSDVFHSATVQQCKDFLSY